MSNVITAANWKFHWRLTESAGIMIYLAEYRGRRVLWEASLPYVTVDHQRDVLEVVSEGTETRGPWWVPLGARTLAGNVRVQPFRGGVERILERRPVPVVPMALKGMWASMWSRRDSRLGRLRLPRRLRARVEVVAAPPVPGASATAESLEAQERALRGDSA